MPAYTMKKGKGGGGGRSIGPANVDPRQAVRDYTIIEDRERAISAKRAKQGGKGDTGDAGTGSALILKAFNRSSQNNVILSTFCNSARVSGYGRLGGLVSFGGLWQGLFSRSTTSSGGQGGLSMPSWGGRTTPNGSTTGGRGSSSGGRSGSGGSGGGPRGGGGFMSSGGGLFSSRR